MAHRVCPWWMAYTFDNPLRRLVHDPAKLLGPYLAPGMTALDAGCGMGYFSIGMARIVGRSGRVVSVDLQQKMIHILSKRARKAGVSSQIDARVCGPGSLGLDKPLDFALAFYMVHEVPSQESFFSEIAAKLKKGAALFLAEPAHHVPEEEFCRSLALAEKYNFRLTERPRIRFSRAGVLIAG